MCVNSFIAGYPVSPSLLPHQDHRDLRPAPFAPESTRPQPQHQHRQHHPAQHQRIVRRCLVHDVRQHLRGQNAQHQSRRRAHRKQQRTPGPAPRCSTCLRRAPSAMRIPSSRSRLLTVYEAMPKIPVTASIAPSSPSTPSATEATRAANNAEPISWLQVLTTNGNPRVQPVQRALQRLGNLLRIAVRPHQQPGAARLLLQEREEHRRLLILGQRPVFPVFHHAHHFRPRSAPELEMPADRLVSPTRKL